MSACYKGKEILLQAGKTLPYKFCYNNSTFRKK
jgi:hypothetical protein